MNSSEEKTLTDTRKFELIYSQDKIAERIKELGNQISQDYKEKDPVLIGVLKGCILFFADLIREISVPIELEFVNASSYNGGVEPDKDVVLSSGPKISLTGRHVLLVEGVVDSGHTAVEIMKQVRLEDPASVEMVSLLNKPKCRKMPVEIKYIGFEAEDYFVIGFGLDQGQKYRNLPFIGRVLNNND
ncbi:MAG: hypoxanthine phosphoribosyltransferase [candidate division Zixibacteria bacterium]|nr:hypoxanthine phosphoribosyltransferase [candidate division Zixibacteria bacterium]